MRIGGAFTFSVPDLINGGGVIALGSGGVFYPPAGNYILNSGGVTVPQTFDPVGQMWRQAGVPFVYNMPFETDGYNWRLVNMSGVVAGANITNAGSGAINGIGTVATGVTLGFTAPTTPGITATAYPIVGGAVVAPTVAQSGSGFLVPPLVVIDPPPPGGIQATAIAALNGSGGIASITMLNVGAGYGTGTVTGAPNFYLIPQTNVYQGVGAGSTVAGVVPPSGQVNPLNAAPTVQPVFLGTQGALLNPASLTGSGTLTGIVMVNYGSFYTGTTIPTISIVGCGAAAATALMSFSMTGFSSLSGGSGYGAGIPPVWELSEGFVASLPGNQLGDVSPASGVTTLSGGAVNNILIEEPGFGFQKVPVASVINTSAIATGIATFVPVVGGINDFSTLQPRIGS